MNPNPHSELLIYGVLLVVLSPLAYKFAPGFEFATLLFCLVSGGLVFCCGVLGWRGVHQRRWAIALLSLLIVGLLVQTARTWLTLAAGGEHVKRAGVLLAVMTIFGIVQMVNYVRQPSNEE